MLRNEILTDLNKPDQYILAIVEVEDSKAHPPRYARKPFKKEPDFGVTSVNYNLNELLARSQVPAPPFEKYTDMSETQDES